MNEESKTLKVIGIIAKLILTLVFGLSVGVCVIRAIFYVFYSPQPDYVSAFIFVITGVILAFLYMLAIAFTSKEDE